MKRIFLEKYFLASRAANIRKDNYDIKKNIGESLHEYWEWFKKLCASCPQHQISENILIQYCYEGLLPHDRSMVDAVSGGVFVYKTPQDTMNLIENMAANSQQFGTNRSDPTPRRNNEVNVSSLEQKLIELTYLVRQMAVGNGQNVKVCGICTAMEHATDMCPTLQEESVEKLNATGGFPGPPQQKYDPYSNTYNPGWRDHPNLRYGNPPMNQPTPHVQLNNQAYWPPFPPQPERPQIPTPVGQLATAINKLEAQHSSSFPSQTILNPKENANAITLRNGKELKIQEKVFMPSSKYEQDEEVRMENKEPNQGDTQKGKFPPLSEYKHVPPFPLALKESRKDEGIKELYDTFRKCEVKIPLLNAIKQVPLYTKFFKELCTAKIKQTLKGCQKVELGENVSAVIQRKLPQNAVYDRKC
ncbi:uncharacterized protein [Henckelia pumila]|uniref:uncharacterized protein n=1 Tax=Henckelia pumila TaxID=405737 RepID=UPI003C6E0BFD